MAGAKDDMSLRILLVEDSAGDVRREPAHAVVPRPDRTLLDLNLPKMAGREVLVHIKDDGDLKTIPTVILATSEAPIDISTSYNLRANCYLTKPVQFAAFQSLVNSLNDLWLTKASLPRQARA